MSPREVTPEELIYIAQILVMFAAVAQRAGSAVYDPTKVLELSETLAANPKSSFRVVRLVVIAGMGPDANLDANDRVGMAVKP